jgi:hypothetical protein
LDIAPTSSALRVADIASAMRCVGAGWLAPHPTAAAIVIKAMRFLCT